jgi:hypothetical protein
MNFVTMFTGFPYRGNSRSGFTVMLKKGRAYRQAIASLNRRSTDRNFIMVRRGGRELKADDIRVVGSSNSAGTHDPAKLWT